MKKILDNDKFVAENFEEIVRLFAHKRIVICHGEIFTGDDAVKQARARFPKSIPMLLPVPGSEFFSHHHLL